MKRELIDLIGTDTCAFCEKLTECLSLPDDGEYPQMACRECIEAAFAEVTS